jgi:hypothetical protein
VEFPLQDSLEKCRSLQGTHESSGSTGQNVRKLKWWLFPLGNQARSPSFSEDSSQGHGQLNARYTRNDQKGSYLAPSLLPSRSEMASELP